MLYIGVTLHYIHVHFTDPSFVPRQLNMKQVTNIQDTRICERTSNNTKTTDITELQYKK